MARARSGQAALARVLERWLAHLLGIRTTIRPLPRIDDDAWAWHIGLDVEATALLDDLYRGHAPEQERLRRLIGLFRLDFADPSEMRADLAGKPVYLGLAMTEDGTLAPQSAEPARQPAAGRRQLTGAANSPGRPTARRWGRTAARR